MSVKDDVELVRRGYEAFIAGDMVWLDEHLHRNVVWHVPGHSVLSGTHQGRDAVVAFLIKMVKIALPEFDFHDILGTEDHVVVLANITWRRQDNGETFSGRTATVFHLDAGRVIEVWALDEDPEGFDTFVEGAA
ncbi:MAG TPA: nuclear transport factor 2 family protein [Actinomycetota bacterium]